MKLKNEPAAPTRIKEVTLVVESFSSIGRMRAEDYRGYSSYPESYDTIPIGKMLSSIQTWAKEFKVDPDCFSFGTTYGDNEHHLIYRGPEPEKDFDARVAKYLEQKETYDTWYAKNKEAVDAEHKARKDKEQLKKEKAKAKRISDLERSLKRLKN